MFLDLLDVLVVLLFDRLQVAVEIAGLHLAGGRGRHEDDIAWPLVHLGVGLYPRRLELLKLLINFCNFNVLFILRFRF